MLSKFCLLFLGILLASTRAEPNVEPSVVSSATVQKPAVCCQPDLVFVIDRSTIDRSNYAATIRPIIINLFDSLSRCAELKLSFIEYGSSVHIRSLLSDHKSPENLRRYVENYTPGANSLGSKSLLADAFEGILSQVLTTARGKRQGSPSYVLLFAGKDAPNPPIAIAKADRLKHDLGAKVIVIGIGNGYSPDVARKIASGTHFFYPTGETIDASAVSSRLFGQVCAKKVDVATESAAVPANIRNKPQAIERPFHRNQVKTGSGRQHERATPREYCLDSAKPRSGTQFIQHPDNCHDYIQCDYHNESSVVTSVKHCRSHEIFNEDASVCVLEGPSPCSDYCRHNHIAHNGCYGLKGDCATFFLCSHGSSYAKCCPPGSHFDADSCSCEVDTENKCSSKCKLTPTSNSLAHDKLAAESSSVGLIADDGTCIDAYNNTLRVHIGRPDLFEVVEDVESPTPRTFTVPCAAGSIFSTKTCRCEHLTNYEAKKSSANQPFVKGHQCRLYLPFDEDITDHSISKFSVYSNGRVVLNAQNDSAVGEGKSLLMNSGYLEIPGLAGYDQGNQGSWCLFYRCQQQKESFACSKSGGLLSNNKDSFGSSYSIILATQYKNQIMARLRLIQPMSSINLNTTVATEQGWNQVCVVYDGANVDLYSNGISVLREEAHGRLPSVSFPYLIGTDHRYGTFSGSIDEVLMCDHAMSKEEVVAHYNGNRDYLVAKGLIPSKVAADNNKN